MEHFRHNPGKYKKIELGINYLYFSKKKFSPHFGMAANEAVKWKNYIKNIKNNTRGWLLIKYKIKNFFHNAGPQLILSAYQTFTQISYTASLTYSLEISSSEKLEFFLSESSE